MVKSELMVNSELVGNGGWELIFPEDIQYRRASLERSLFRVGERKGLTVEATIGNFPYPFSNMGNTDWMPNSTWLRRRFDGEEVLINIHESDEIEHRRFFIHSSSTEEALTVLPNLNSFLRYSDVFRFVIPIPDRKYHDDEVKEILRTMEFEQRGNSVTVAQMYWPDRDSFVGCKELLPGDTLIDPLTMGYYWEARRLYDKNYRIHSFHPEDLSQGKHAGLVRSNGVVGRLIAACGRTMSVRVESVNCNVAILKDAVVEEKLRKRGRMRYLATLSAEYAYGEGADVIGLDATSIAAQKTVEKLGAQLGDYRRWYVAQRITRGALAE